MKKKIIYYCADIDPTRNTSLGIYKTTKEILKQLINKNELELNLVLTDNNKNLFSKFSCKKRIIPKNNYPYFLNKLFIYPSWANKFAKEEDITLIFLPKGHVPPIRKNKIKYISFIHDLIPIYYLKKGQIKYLISSILLLLSARYSDLIFTNSLFSKKQINKFTSRRIISVPLGISNVRPQTPPLEKDSYIFIIGNTSLHKNLGKSKDLIKKYNSLKGSCYKIFCSSGNLTEEQLAGYYSNAKFSIFLSSIEGFGLPFIETYNYLTPIVFNNETSLREIGKGLPGSCNIKDPKSVFKAMDKILIMSKKEILKIKSKLLKNYNWGKCGDIICKELIKINI